MEIRLARLDDAEAIRQIYNLEVSSSTVTFDLVPRSLEEQLTWLQARSGAHAVIVADDDGEVVGFASLSPYRDRPAYNSTVEDSVYVRCDQRGSAGRAAPCSSALVATAAQHGFHTVIARIVGDHEASIALHAALGFDRGGHRTRGGPQVRPLARRRAHAAPPVATRLRHAVSEPGRATH